MKTITNDLIEIAEGLRRHKQIWIGRQVIENSFYMRGSVTNGDLIDILIKLMK